MFRGGVGLAFPCVEFFKNMLIWVSISVAFLSELHYLKIHLCIGSHLKLQSLLCGLQQLLPI